MTTLNFLSIAATFLALLLILQPRPRLLNAAPIFLFLIVLVNIIVNGYQANILSVYLITIALILIAVRRLLRAKSTTLQTRSRRSWTAGLLATGLALLGLLMAIRATLFFSLPPADLTRLNWSAAFDQMHARLSKTYAFGDWKEIDWDTLYDTYAPRIFDAGENKDRQAYYLTLQSYISAIPDGHVWLEGDDFGTRQQMVGGGYGLEIAALDDGRIIAVTITPGGPAEKAGLLWGAELLTWNGLPIESALEQTAVIWPKRRGAPATAEGLALEKLRLLVRNPVGTQLTITFLNPGASEPEGVVLTAVHDGQMDQDGNNAPGLIPVEKGLILSSGYGYLKINNEHEENEPTAAVQGAIQYFVDSNVPGVIVDVRGNTGGTDDLVPRFVGYFFRERHFYEAITIYFQPFNSFIERPSPIWIEPLEPHYDGPVAVLIDQACFSSGEGIPMALAHLPQSAVIGFTGTYGSFGMTGGVILMPEGLTLHFPDGQSLDENGIIQLDSSAALEGGVAPTIRLPLTEETARALYLDHQDVLLDYAINYLNGRS
ncbi:MAG: S41 family peptidase [Candidatus Promineifilaceae bacterium]